MAKKKNNNNNKHMRTFSIITWIYPFYTQKYFFFKKKNQDHYIADHLILLNSL